jgi:hypothetical protein
MAEIIITLEQALEILRRHKADFEEKYGITEIGVFGSVARGQSGNESDVDVVVKMKKPDLFYMVHIKDELENEYKTNVDIIHYRERMNPLLKQRIDREAVYV